jgi:mRNA-degrading endonuclease toxin of MazEF toxin-antitoxin module
VTTLPEPAPRQFDVWWAALPEPAGRRPVLLLGRTSAFGYLARVLVVEVTTTVRGIPQEVTLGRREGLMRRCVANLDAIRTIPTASLASRAGKLGHGRHVEVKRALGHVLHWAELTGL